MDKIVGGEISHFPDRKLVFICSHYSGSVKQNIESAKKYARYAALKGNAVFVPHLLYPQFLDDAKENEREIGISSGIEFLWLCDEIWVFAKDERCCSNGMKAEIAEAKKNPTMKIMYIDPESINVI